MRSKSPGSTAKMRDCVVARASEWAIAYRWI